MVPGEGSQVEVGDLFVADQAALFDGDVGKIIGPEFVAGVSGELAQHFLSELDGIGAGARLAAVEADERTLGDGACGEALGLIVTPPVWTVTP